MVMTSRPPPATNRTRSRPSVSTSRKSMSARHLLRNARNFWQHATTLKLTKQQSNFYRAMRCISAVFAVMQCLSVCLSRSWVAPKRIKISSKFIHHRVATSFYFFHTKGNADIPTGTPLTGASNARGYDKMTICSQISRSISETVIVRWAHAAIQFVSIKFSFHPYNI